MTNSAGSREDILHWELGIETLGTMGGYRGVYTNSLLSGTWSRSPERNPSISVSVSTHSTSSVSTRCCHVPVPIDCKLECVVLGESQMEVLPVSTLVKSS